MGNNRFDLLSLGEILLRLSPPDNERIVSGETFQKQVGGTPRHCPPQSTGSSP